MKITSYAANKFEISQIKENGFSEVILGCRDLNRFSKNSNQELVENAKFAKELGLKTILEWDILCTESDFIEMTDSFNQMDLALFDFLRVQDPGVLEYCLEKTPTPIHFISETGNHNLTGLKKWESYIGSRLDRLVISSEINAKTIKRYKTELDADLEILALGRILLFYTPRKLLNHLLPEDDELKIKSIKGEEFIEALGESEESPHKGFPVVENKHGTFMFHIKDLFLLDKKEELEETKVDFLRIDLRFESDNSLLSEITENFVLKDNPQAIKAKYNKEVIRGYFQVNKSDVLFKKLKNYRIQRKDSSYIGEISEIAKSDYMAVSIKGKVSLKTEDQIYLITPEGKKISTKVFFLKNANYKDVDSRGFGELALINYVGGVWPKSQVYFDN